MFEIEVIPDIAVENQGYIFNPHVFWRMSGTGLETLKFHYWNPGGNCAKNRCKEKFKDRIDEQVNRLINGPGPS